jgi:hypothetical protein
LSTTDFELPAPPSIEELQAIVEQIDEAARNDAPIEEITQLIERLMIGHQKCMIRLQPGLRLYRARPMNELPKNVSEISTPPKESCRSHQRCNRAGRPMFYCSDHKSAPLSEVHAKTGDQITFSLWSTTDHLLVNIVGYSEPTFQRLKARRICPDWSRGTNQVPESIAAQNTFVDHYLSELFSQQVPDENDRLYKPSIAITERFLQTNILPGTPGIRIDDLSIEGIMYPTIALRASCENLALTEKFAAEGLSLFNAIFVQVQKIGDLGLYSYRSLYHLTGIGSDGSLTWERSRPLVSTWEYPGPYRGFI